MRMGLIKRCCIELKTAEFEGIRVVVDGWDGGGLFDVWAFFEGVYGSQMVPKS